jgi:hypothetical protein
MAASRHPRHHETPTYGREVCTRNGTRGSIKKGFSKRMVWGGWEENIGDMRGRIGDTFIRNHPD